MNAMSEGREGWKGGDYIGCPHKEDIPNRQKNGGWISNCKVTLFTLVTSLPFHERTKHAASSYPDHLQHNHIDCVGNSLSCHVLPKHDSSKYLSYLQHNHIAHTRNASPYHVRQKMSLQVTSLTCSIITLIALEIP